MATAGRKAFLPEGSKRRTIWASDELWERVKRKARDDDRGLSSWIRKALEKAAGR